jgi:MFS superfamily sulfate permease-like transporter
VVLDPNQEFRAYGIAELGAGIMGGMVATGSLSKSSVAIAAGAKTQMCNLFLAVIVVAVLLVLSPAFQWLPEAALAAVVIAAMWGSANPCKVTQIFAIDRVDFALGLITAIVVLAWNLLPAMVTGIVLSIAYLVYRSSFPSRAELGRIEGTGDYEVLQWESGGHKGKGNPKAHTVPGVIVYRFDAPLVFSNAETFQDTGRKLLIAAGATGELPHTMVIDCEGMFYTDFTGAEAVSSGSVREIREWLSLARLHTGAGQSGDRRHANRDVASSTRFERRRCGTNSLARCTPARRLREARAVI